MLFLVKYSKSFSFLLKKLEKWKKIRKIKNFSFSRIALPCWKGERGKEKIFKDKSFLISWLHWNGWKEQCKRNDEAKKISMGEGCLFMNHACNSSAIFHQGFNRNLWHYSILSVHSLSLSHFLRQTNFKKGEKQKIALGECERAEGKMCKVTLNDLFFSHFHSSLSSSLGTENSKKFTQKGTLTLMQVKYYWMSKWESLLIIHSSWVTIIIKKRPVVVQKALIFSLRQFFIKQKAKEKW